MNLLNKVFEKDICIVGSGPSGLFAAFQAGMLGLSNLVIESLDTVGGQCAHLYPQKNIYDIPAMKKVSGQELTDALYDQALSMNAKFLLNNKVCLLYSCSSESVKFLKFVLQVVRGKNLDFVNDIVSDFVRGDGDFDVNHSGNDSKSEPENGCVSHGENDVIDGFGLCVKNVLSDKNFIGNLNDFLNEILLGSITRASSTNVEGPSNMRNRANDMKNPRVCSSCSDDSVCNSESDSECAPIYNFKCDLYERICELKKFVRMSFLNALIEGGWVDIGQGSQNQAQENQLTCQLDNSVHSYSRLYQIIKDFQNKHLQNKCIQNTQKHNTDEAQCYCGKFKRDSISNDVLYYILEDILNCDIANNDVSTGMANAGISNGNASNPYTSNSSNSDISNINTSINDISNTRAPNSHIANSGSVSNNYKLKSDEIFLVTTSNNDIVLCKSIIIAAGAGSFEPKRIPLPSIAKHENKSVFYSVKNKELFKNKKVIIMGGGDSALDWARDLSDIANVTLIHRRMEFTGASSTLSQVLSNIHVLKPYALQNIVEKDNQLQSGQLKGVLLRNLETNEVIERETDYILAFFGLSTNMGKINEWGLKLGYKNRIVTNPITTETSRGMIYAVGDCSVNGRSSKLIVTGFDEASQAVHSIYAKLYPGVKLDYSTTKFDK